ncbi:MAG: hypothetical protein VX457_06145 [Actinomycetota bacterium]|nr:hypothetical protein [Actinomycetota bacterium]
MNVRNLSGSNLDKYDRGVIELEIETYLGMKNDCPVAVVTQVWNDDGFDFTGIRPVRDGYSVEEVVADLKDYQDEDYKKQVWWVCHLSPSFKTVMVKEVIRAD